MLEPQRPNDDELQKTELLLPAETLRFLREEARKRGVSTGDMVRIALSNHKFLSEQVEGGAKVQLKDRSKTFDVTL